MHEIPESWDGTESPGRVVFYLRRLGLHPGASWSLSWVVLFVAGALTIGLPDSPPAQAAGFVLASVFPALTLMGAYGFASRRTPLWLVPLGLGVGVLGAGCVLAGASHIAYAAALPGRVPLEVAAAVIVWRAGLLEDHSPTRWVLSGAIFAIAVADGSEATARMLGAPPDWMGVSWVVLAPTTALIEVGAMWFWIARREVRVERAEGSERALEDELDDHVRLEREMERELEEHVRVERDLRGKEALLFDRYERAPDLLVSLDPKTGVIQSCNRKFSETLGYRRRELVGRPLADFADVSTLAALERGLEDASHDGGLRDVAFRLQRRNGAFIDVLANAAILQPADSEPELHAILRNISRIPLAHSDETPDERLYHTLVERSPVAIFFADTEGRCVFVNQRFCEISGLTPDEARGYGWMNRVHPADSDRVAEEWDEAMEKRQGFRSRQRLLTGPQGEIEVIVETTPIPSLDDGAPTGHVGTVTLLQGGM